MGHSQQAVGGATKWKRQNINLETTLYASPVCDPNERQTANPISDAPFTLRRAERVDLVAAAGSKFQDESHFAMEIGRQARAGGREGDRRARRRGGGKGGGELCMMEMGRQAARQQEDDGGGGRGDLQGRKVIKSFFLFLFPSSFVRSLVKVSHFYKDEREEMKRQRRPDLPHPAHSNLPLPTSPSENADQSEKGSEGGHSVDKMPLQMEERSVMEGASRPKRKSAPDSFSELLSVCTGNLQKNLTRLCEIG